PPSDRPWPFPFVRCAVALEPNGGLPPGPVGRTLVPWRAGPRHPQSDNSTARRAANRSHRNEAWGKPMTLIDPFDRPTFEVPRDGHEYPVLDTLGQVVEQCGARQDVYLRFGDGPDDGDASARRERASGYLLPGVPAWPLCPEPWWGAGARVWVARQLARRAYLGHAGAEPWLVTGEVR